MNEEQMKVDLLKVYEWGGGGSYSMPVAPPAEESAEMKAAAEEARQRELALAKKKKGRLSTILTNPWGAEGSPQLGAGTLSGGKTKLGQ